MIPFSDPALEINQKIKYYISGITSASIIIMITNFDLIQIQTIFTNTMTFSIWELQNEQTFLRFCITIIFPETNIVFTVERTCNRKMLTSNNYVWHTHSHFVNFISNEQSCSGPQTSLIGRSTGQSECRSRLQKKDIITCMINSRDINF